MWHKAVSRWVRSLGKAHTRPALPKIPSGPAAFPLLGALQAPGDKPTPPPNWVKAWENSPLRPDELSIAEAQPPEPSRGETACRMRPNNCQQKFPSIRRCDVIV